MTKVEITQGDALTGTADDQNYAGVTSAALRNAADRIGGRLKRPLPESREEFSAESVANDDDVWRAACAWTRATSDKRVAYLAFIAAVLRASGYADLVAALEEALEFVRGVHFAGWHEHENPGLEEKIIAALSSARHTQGEPR